MPDHSCTKQENLLRKWTQPPGAGENTASGEKDFSPWTQKSAVLCLLLLSAQVVLDESCLLRSLALGGSFPLSDGLNDECRLS